MKILILSLLLLSGCAAFAPAPNSVQTSQFCASLDVKQEFARCETAEIVAYKYGNLVQIIPKPKPESKDKEVSNGKKSEEAQGSETTKEAEGNKRAKK